MNSEIQKNESRSQIRNSLIAERNLASMVELLLEQHVYSDRRISELRTVLEILLPDASALSSLIMEGKASEVYFVDDIWKRTEMMLNSWFQRNYDTSVPKLGSFDGWSSDVMSVVSELTTTSWLHRALGLKREGPSNLVSCHLSTSTAVLAGADTNRPPNITGVFVSAQNRLKVGNADDRYSPNMIPISSFLIDTNVSVPGFSLYQLQNKGDDIKLIDAIQFTRMQLYSLDAGMNISVDLFYNLDIYSLVAGQMFRCQNGLTNVNYNVWRIELIVNLGYCNVSDPLVNGLRPIDADGYTVLLDVTPTLTTLNDGTVRTCLRLHADFNVQDIVGPTLIPIYIDNMTFRIRDESFTWGINVLDPPLGYTTVSESVIPRIDSLEVRTSDINARMEFATDQMTELTTTVNELVDGWNTFAQNEREEKARSVVWGTASNVGNIIAGLGGLTMLFPPLGLGLIALGSAVSVSSTIGQMVETKKLNVLSVLSSVVTVLGVYGSLRGHIDARILAKAESMVLNKGLENIRNKNVPEGAEHLAAETVQFRVIPLATGEGLISKISNWNVFGLENSGIASSLKTNLIKAYNHNLLHSGVRHSSGFLYEQPTSVEFTLNGKDVLTTEAISSRTIRDMSYEMGLHGTVVKTYEFLEHNIGSINEPDWVLGTGNRVSNSSLLGIHYSNYLGANHSSWQVSFTEKAVVSSDTFAAMQATENHWPSYQVLGSNCQWISKEVYNFATKGRRPSGLTNDGWSRFTSELMKRERSDTSGVQFTIQELNTIENLLLIEYV